VCGRFVSATPPDELAAYFGAALGGVAVAEGVAIPDNYNVAPTNEIYAVVDTPSGPEVAAFHWGLIPSWAKDRKIASTMINARSETILSKPVFKGLFAAKRCIIPVDGFYEWKAGAGVPDAKGKPTKQPHFIHSLSGEPLAFAGLWTSWRDPAAPDAGRLHSATIITTSANATMQPVHDRMPVILPADLWGQWLDIENRDVTRLAEFLKPAPESLLRMHAVATDVNNVRNKGPHLAVSIE
jgi:putative SOS response-associated peptidase YedK